MKITANMLTLARIVLLPLPVIFLVTGTLWGQWVAFTLFLILGVTDWIDGILARRDGVTKLGSLLDPVADKMFIAAAALSLSAVAVMPAWIAAAIIAREFLLTALRSSVSFRREQIKTSKLAKLKTIYQMGGFGTIFLTLGLPVPLLLLVYGALWIGLLSWWLYFIFRRESPRFWILPVGLAFLLVFVMALTVSNQTSMMVQALIIVAITWISAVDYISGCYRIFIRSGLTRDDVARIFWVFSFAILVVPLVYWFPTVVLPVLISVSFELALGGVDNVIAIETEHSSPIPFFITATAGAIFGLLLLEKLFVPWPIDIVSAAWLLASVSIVVFSVVFYRWRTLFKRALD